MPFAGSNKKQYLCTVKRIEYICPIDYVRGNISGRQSIEYAGGTAYDAIATGESVSSGNYQPRIVAAVRRLYDPTRIKYFSVRTRTTVNMSAGMRRSMAILGGAGALYAVLVSDKTAAIYLDCVAACPKGWTLRSFVMPLLMSGLSAKSAQIAIADGINISNPWVYTGTQTLVVDPSIINKFNSVLS